MELCECDCLSNARIKFNFDQYIESVNQTYWLFLYKNNFWHINFQQQFFLCLIILKILMKIFVSSIGGICGIGRILQIPIEMPHKIADTTDTDSSWIIKGIFYVFQIQEVICISSSRILLIHLSWSI